MSLPKIRAWDKESKFMTYGSLEYFDDSIGYRFRHFTVDSTFEVEFMQSIGLKDKNGVESWEGNYLTREGYPRYVIEWVEEYGCLMAVAVDPIQKTNWKPEMVRELLKIDFVNEGNIYTNPELLKEG